MRQAAGLRMAAGAVPAAQGTPLGDHYVRALAFSLVAYALLGRSFAHMGVAPLFVGEILYVLGLAVALRSGCAFATVASAPNVVLLALAGWTLARTLPFLPVHGLNAPRDAVVVLYCAFAFIVCALLIERPQRLQEGLRFYGRFAAVYGATAGIGYAAQQLLGNRGLLPSFPTTGVPLIAVKPGDMAVHLLGTAVFALLFFRRFSLVWVGLLTAAMAMVAVHNRGGLLAMALPLIVAIAFSGRARELAGIVVLGAAAVLVAWLLDINVSLMERERAVSVDQLVRNVLSIFMEKGADDLDGTKQWRMRWWTEIVTYTFQGPYFWNGKGFGIGLAVADGFAGVTPPGAPELRSPHNVSMTILARGGVPGLVLWLATLGAWFGMVARNAWLARRRGEEAWFRLFLFIGCYLAAALINASFDVALEGPMLGIWFWVLFGFGCGAGLIYATQRAALAMPPRAVPLRPAGGRR